METSMNVVYGNHIVGNTIEDVEIGLNFQNVSETTVQDNTIRDTVAGIHFLDGQRDNQSIENNTFEDNDYSLYDYSVDLKDDDNDIISIPFTRDELDALLANNSFPPGSIVDTEEYDGNEFYVIREDSE
ncbi:MAG: NosD domain-containing protein [Acholeplasmataceae bacterium]